MCSFSIKILLVSAINVFWIPSVKELIIFHNFKVLIKKLQVFSQCPVSDHCVNHCAFKAFSFDFSFMINNISSENQFTNIFSYFVCVLYCYFHSWFDYWFLQTFCKFYKADFLSNKTDFSYFSLIFCFPLQWCYLHTIQNMILVH